MTGDRILELLFYTAPAIVVGLVAFYFLKTWQVEQSKKRFFELRKENQKEALPLRLQAYERMTLFLERISLGSLLVRIKPFDETPSNYEALLLKTIEQEFEHNISQQIYLSERAWNVVKASKNATLSIIRKTALKESVETSDQLRKTILSDLVDKQSPTDAGLAQLREDVRQFM